jgi:chromosome transmission fidelity protein 18
LKLWDGCVFKRKCTIESTSEIGGGKFAPKKWQQTRELSAQLDKLQRPADYKVRAVHGARTLICTQIVLLHGPPGLGKTTMAHVVATKAGYNVIEMNASDDRQLAHFEERIDGALGQTRALSTDAKLQRPNCLVIDEIDGAPAVCECLSVFCVPIPVFSRLLTIW